LALALARLSAHAASAFAERGTDARLAFAVDTAGVADFAAVALVVGSAKECGSAIAIV
jgi:hypothetical protein